MRVPVFILSFLIAGSVASAGEVATAIFSYDKSAPFVTREIGNQQRGAATIHDIALTSAGSTIKAFLITPATPGPHAGILYVHWLGEPSTSNRTEFLDEAVALASRGTVSLLVDTMWAEPKWYGQRVPEEDFAHSIRQVVELRRAMDFLMTQPDVDSKRIAVVAHDFGAMYGMIAAAQDRKARTYVFMAAVPHLVDWMLFARQPLDPSSYRRQLAPLDPGNFIGQLAPASVFFQYANKDKFVSAAQAAEFYAAAQPRKQMATYDGGHELHTSADTTDRIAWLERELELKP
jgi:dienelactone hydrolase